MSHISDIDKRSRDIWLEEVKEIAVRIENCPWCDLPALNRRLHEIDGQVGFPHVCEYMYYNAGIQTRQDRGYFRKRTGKKSNEIIRLEDYSSGEFLHIIQFLWETIPERIVRRIRRHLKEASLDTLKDELKRSGHFEELKIGVDYRFDFWPRVLWDIAKEEMIVALENEKEPAYGIVLCDSCIGLYKIIMRQEPAPCGSMQIRWGDYSHSISLEEFVHHLQCPDDKVLELESDLCELWLSKLTDLRKTGLNRSRRFSSDAYQFAAYSSDSNWSLEAFDYHYAFSKKDWDITWKIEVEELVKDMILRADRQRPLWKQRGLIRNIASIPDTFEVQNGEFEISFNPSFNAPLRVSIVSSKGESKLIARYKDRMEAYEIQKDIAEIFLKLVNFLSKVEPIKNNRLTLDGIGISGHLKAESIKEFSFSFRTPEKVETPRDYGIVEAVFYVFNSIQPSATLKDYLKDLSMYFFEGGPFMLVKI